MNGVVQGMRINLFYQTKMQHLGQIQLDKTVTVKVQCNLNDQVVIKNFKIIMDCLKNLQANHNDLSSKFNTLSDKFSHLEQASQSQSQSNTGNNNSNSKQGPASMSSELSESQKQNLANAIKQLQKRLTQNQKNTMDNIKDINLINKQIQDLKKLLSKYESSQGNSATDNIAAINENTPVTFESINNINKEMLRNRDMVGKVNEELEKLRKEMLAMGDKMKNIVGDFDKGNKNGGEKGATQGGVGANGSSNGSNGSNGNNGNNSELGRAEMNELREKIVILNKKTNGLEMLTDDLRNQNAALLQGQQSLTETMNQLKSQIAQLQNLLQKQSSSANQSYNTTKDNISSSSSKQDMEQLKKLKDQLSELRDEIEDMKREGHNNSKTSIEEEKKNSNRNALTQNRFKDDGLKDAVKELLARVDYLEKYMGSRNSIEDRDKGQGQDKDKLPLIKRNKVKERDASISDRPSKKDISDIKAEMQAWINNYLADLKSKDNFEDLQLKIQEMKNLLNKKADQEGLKKGLTFLESKINQLYLFLTEPDGDDAMIVRKGFNCLSCSKKVEKLRGKIGPHINWNNMTSMNYSPPKVGYSRHLGEGSAQRDDDQE